jgi:hypothetical protein
MQYFTYSKLNKLCKIHVEQAIYNSPCMIKSKETHSIHRPRQLNVVPFAISYKIRGSSLNLAIGNNLSNAQITFFTSARSRIALLFSA